MVKRTLSWYKKKLWKIVSLYIRLYYADDSGYVICYTCGVVKHYKQMQAGHGLAGRGNSILFELDIIRPQCYGCNCCNSGKLDIFTYKLRKDLGNKRFEELYQQKNKPRKFTIPELEELIAHYKEKVKELE